MLYLCLGRIYLNKDTRARTLPAPGRVQPPLHTSGPPRDNCPVLQTVWPTPTAPSAAPVVPPWHTTCAPLLHPCSRPHPHRVPWPNEAAPRHFPGLRPSGSTLLLSRDRLPRQSLAHT